MRLLAKNVTVSINGKSVGNLTDCSLLVNVVTTETRTKSGKTVTADYADWEVSLTANYSTTMSQPSLATKGANVPVEFRIGSLASYTGDALVSSYTANMPVQGEASYSMTLKGVSSLAKKVNTVTEE